MPRRPFWNHTFREPGRRLFAGRRARARARRAEAESRRNRFGRLPALMAKMARVQPEIRQAVAEGELPIARMIPSGLTIIGLCCGATAMRFAWYGHFKGAVAAIVAAAVFDLLDGRAARLFGTDSAFGAQLDSLADLVSFGIAPAMLVYMWTLNGAGAAGWAAVLAFCVCCAVRLARFNTETANDDVAPVAY